MDEVGWWRCFVAARTFHKVSTQARATLIELTFGCWLLCL